MRLLLLFLLLPLVTFSQAHLPCIQTSKYQNQWKNIGPFNTPSEIKNQHFGSIISLSVNPLNENEIFTGSSTSGLFHTTNKGKNWECLTDSFMYPLLGVNDIYIDYSKKPFTILLAVGSNNIWYDGLGFGILKSIDGGKTWKNYFKESPDYFTSMITLKIVYDSIHHTFYAMGKKAIIRGKNDGENWDIIYSSANTDLLVDNDFEINSILLCNSNNDLLFTTHRGNKYNDKKELIAECEVVKIENCNTNHFTYSKITPIIKQADVANKNNTTNSFKVTSNYFDSSVVVIDRTCNETRAHTIYYFDCKKNEIKSLVAPNYNQFTEDGFWFDGLKQQQKSPLVMYYSGTSLFKSTDEGTTFKPLFPYNFGDNNVPHVDIHTCVIYQSSLDGNTDKLFLGTDGGISYSDDGGKTFQNLNGEHFPITQFYGLGISPFTSTISGGTQDNSIFSYIPKDNTWHFNVRGDGYDVEYNQRKKYEAYGQYNSRVLLKTTNDIAPFDKSAYLRGEHEPASNKKTLAGDIYGNMYFADRSFYKLNYKATSWTESKLPIEHQTLAFAVAESDTNIIYLSNYWNKLFKSVDAGKTFIDISDKIIINGQYQGDNRFHSICVSPYNENELWISSGYLGNGGGVCTPSYRIFYSNNGGNTWTDYSAGLPVYYTSDIAFLKGTQNALFASNYEGVFFRENEFEDWKLYGSHLPKCLIPEIKIDYCRKKLVAASFGRGMWEVDLPNCNYNHPTIIKKKTILETNDSTEALFFTNDIVLKKNAKLIVRCEVHLPKNAVIKVKNKQQIVFENNGKFVNECGEKWGGVVEY